MKGIKQLLAVAMCGILALTTMACAPGGGNGGDDNSDKTVVTMYVGGGGFGSDTYKQSAARFAETVATKQYEEGKTGAIIDVQVAPDSNSIKIDQSLLAKGYHIISGSSYWETLQTAITSGYVANLDDIIRTTIPGETKTIADKINVNQRWTYGITDQNSENADKLEYYAFPGVQSFGGLTYDKDMFDNNAFYFAAPDAQEDKVSKAYCSILNQFYNFTADENSKSVGPDGVKNTEDDGLPSSLYELIALCQRIKPVSAPFAYTKAYSWYINYFADALYASLLGKNNASAINNFKSDAMEVVVGFTDENLFPGAPSLGLKVPITQTVKVDESCGYYVTHSLEKYYVYAFFKLMEDQGWYKATGTNTHTQVQADFIFGKRDSSRSSAMLIECSYWYNESTIRGNFTDYELGAITEADKEREIRWMSLPVNIKTTVTGQEGSVNTGFNTESTKGETMVLSESGDGFMCVNKRFENDPAVMAVIKDYLLFLFSDAELSKFTVSGCYPYAVEYSVNPADYENADSFVKSYMKLTANATVAYAAGNSDVYRNNRHRFVRGGNSGFFATTDSYGTPIRESLAKDGALKCFKDKILTKEDWNRYFGNNAEVSSAAKYPVGHAKAGQDIIFEG